MKNVDIHVQRRDYGYMLSNRTIRTNKEGIETAKTMWKALMNESAQSNAITRQRLNNGYFEGWPFQISIMPKDAMKGTILFADFGKLPQNAKTFTVEA